MTLTPLINETLTQLYPHQDPAVTGERILQLCKQWESGQHTPVPLDQTRVWMIAYGDSMTSPGAPALNVLHRFSQTWLKERISDIHLLPMYPWSSDDGFSVKDYRQIAPELGGWQDVEAMAKDFNLMFDFVINHISRESTWFKGYLDGDARYENFFLNADPEGNYHQVTRPRALPLLTPFTRKSGEKVHIWTTFSADQIDLNFREPEVLLESIAILLEYAARGARAIRLDAAVSVYRRFAR